MAQSKIPSTKTPTVRDVEMGSRWWQGVLEGEVTDDHVAVSWPAGFVFHAMDFGRAARRTGWEVRLREPIVSLDQAVTLLVLVAPEVVEDEGG